MEQVIQVRGLKKYFGKVKAVDDISFTVERGELFGFLGVNGAGKSTTINMLCTLFRPTAGEIIIGGNVLGREDEAIRRIIGVVYQNNCLDDRLTVRENLMVRGSLYEKDVKKLKGKTEQVCQRLRLEETLDRHFGKLSGGQKRKCEIARALLHTPEILFLDEPTTGLDPATRKTVWESLEKLRQEGMTIFLTTHYMEEAAKCSHIAVMDGGKIREFGTPFSLKEKYSGDKLRLLAKPGTGELLEAKLGELQNRWEEKSVKKSGQKTEERTEQKAEGRAEQKPERRTGQKAEGRAEREAEGRAERETEERTERKAEGRTEQKPDKMSGKTICGTPEKGQAEESGRWQYSFSEKNREECLYDICLQDSMMAIPILKETEDLLDGFELIQGSMDDVFLNITGKNLERV